MVNKTIALAIIMILTFVALSSIYEQPAGVFTQMLKGTATLRPYAVNEIYVDGKSTETAKCGAGQADGLSFTPGTSVCYHVKLTSLTSNTAYLTKPADLQIFEHQEGKPPCRGKVIDTLTLKSSSGVTSTLVGHANVPLTAGKYYWAVCTKGSSSGHEAMFYVSRPQYQLIT